MTHTVDSLMALHDAALVDAIHAGLAAHTGCSTAANHLAKSLALRTALEEALAQRWLPIETAPKDGTKILVACPRLGVCGPANWDANQRAKKPRPYWRHWGEHLWGTSWVRADQPTNWMPLPEPPKEPA